MSASSITPVPQGWHFGCTCGRSTTHPTLRAARAARERHNAREHPRMTTHHSPTGQKEAE